MSKRNIAYVKPQDPSFLAQLKAQIGYKEGPTVDTKRQRLDEEGVSEAEREFLDESDERPQRDDETPQVVVLQSGDLTAEEAAAEEARIAREAAEAPADLSQPIVFKKRKPDAAPPKDQPKDKEQRSKSKRKSTKAAGAKLSFNEDEEDEEDL